MYLSAHTQKTTPRPLPDFVKSKFPGNITAYGVDWNSGLPQDFPIKAAKDLGISEKAFKALQILFPYLNKVFRATGAEFIPQQHSTVANHLAGLQNLCDEIFDAKTRTEIPQGRQTEFDATAKLVRLSLMLHDIPEIPGEISTFCQRLPKAKSSTTTVTETDRQDLERKVAEKLIWHALKAAHEGRDTLAADIHAAVSVCQDQVGEQSSLVEERYHIVNNFVGAIPEIDSDFGSAEFKGDHKALLDAYYLAAKEDEFTTQDASWTGPFIKLIDKLESKFHCGVVGDFSPNLFTMKPEHIIKKEFEQVQTFLQRFSGDNLLKPILTNIIQLFESSVKIYREWAQLEEPLEKFTKWS